MKNKRIKIIIIVILVGVSGYFIVSNNNASIKPELRDFAVEDTASVDKIFLVDKESNQILLEKKEGYWALNEEHVARPDLVRILLKTLHRIKVKEPVSKSSTKNIIKNIAVKSTKVEVYQNGKLSKTFYVGGPTQDSYGTYMIMENSSRPFIMEIPGFRGYLSTRFSTLEFDWKAQTVFNYNLEEIAKVTFQNLKEPKQSFLIKHESNNFELYNYPELNKIAVFDTIKVKRYLFEFKNKNFSKYTEDVPQEYQDSIRASQPMYVINIKTHSGEQEIVKAFNKPGWGRKNFMGGPLKDDPDHFFLLLDNDEFVYAQYFTFDPIFRKLNDFIK